MLPKQARVITVVGADIPLAPTLKSLGVMLDSRLSFNNQVAAMCKEKNASFIYVLFEHHEGIAAKVTNTIVTCS